MKVAGTGVSGPVGRLAGRWPLEEKSSDQPSIMGISDCQTSGAPGRGPLAAAHEHSTATLPSKVPLFTARDHVIAFATFRTQG